MAINESSWRKASVVGGIGKGRPAALSRGGARTKIGVALSVAQFGGKHPKAKPWKGEGSGVLEIVEDHRGDTYRAVYTVKFSQAVLLFFTPSKRNRRKG